MRTTTAGTAAHKAGLTQALTPTCPQDFVEEAQHGVFAVMQAALKQAHVAGPQKLVDPAGRVVADVPQVRLGFLAATDPPRRSLERRGDLEVRPFAQVVLGVRIVPAARVS
jgi:hypothetical protein